MHNHGLQGLQANEEFRAAARRRLHRAHGLRSAKQSSAMPMTYR
jgi:hypothetical protein